MRRAVAATRTLQVGGRHYDHFLQRHNLLGVSPAPVLPRWFSGSRAQLHGGSGPTSASAVPKHVGARDDDDALKEHDHGHGDSYEHDHDHDDHDDDDEDDMEDVVDIGPMGKEYGGPQRGGKFKEPTRFGDWERKGRCTDF
ncbi:hypothetical protein PybrP1_002007 [[Pythium] brassicae (nom. inval.)]|nr:hypothetical protein PybrP1_002007 [[Pythium] brassicae (nom. inval.)]